MTILWPALVSVVVVRMAELSVGSMEAMERLPALVSESPVMKVKVSSMIALPFMISELSRTMWVAMPGDCGTWCLFFDDDANLTLEIEVAAAAAEEAAAAAFPFLAAAPALPPKTRSSLAQASSSALRDLLELLSPCMAAGGCTPISA